MIRFNSMPNSISQIWILMVGYALTVVGWVTTHVLSLRAQSKNLLNQVYNSARIEITQGIREYQGWLGKVNAFFSMLPAQVELERGGMAVDWLRIYSESVPLSYDERSTRWLSLLEEYEILFPRTRQVRMELAGRYSKIQEQVFAVFMDLPVQNKRQPAIQSAQDLRHPIIDMIALLEDIRIYLQNETLHSITGNRVPYRKPLDAAVSRIVMEANGDLKIVPSTAEPDNTSEQRTATGHRR